MAILLWMPIIDEVGLPATAESLLARQRDLGLNPAWPDALNQQIGADLAEHIRKGFESVLPTFQATYEKAISRMVSRVVQSHLTNINPQGEKHLDLSSLNKSISAELSKFQRFQDPTSRAKARGAEEQAEDEEDNGP